MKRRFVRRRLIQTPYNSGDRRRSVCEDVRPKKERPDPGRGQRRNLRKAGCELRSGNERGLRRMFIAASGNQCDCTTVLGAIRVSVNARVQLRRNAQRERPEKGCGKKCRDKGTSAIVETCQAVHRSPSLRQRSTPRKQFLGAHASSCALRGELSQQDGALSALHLPRPLARAPFAVREARALPGLDALHYSLPFSVAVTLR
jgi:hypothetical protein